MTRAAVRLVPLAIGAALTLVAIARLWPSRGGAPSLEAARERLQLPTPKPPVPSAPLASKKPGADEDPEQVAGADSESDEPLTGDWLAKPKRPTRAEIEAAMARVESSVLACRHLEEASGTVTVRLDFATSGAVQSATVLPPFGGTKTGQCVQRAASTARLPAFAGVPTPTVQVTYPYYFAPSD